MALAGNLTVWHAFAQGTPGSDYPNGLVEGDDGKFYGSNANFGGNQNGNVFRMTRKGAVTACIDSARAARHFRTMARSPWHRRSKQKGVFSSAPRFWAAFPVSHPGTARSTGALHASPTTREFCRLRARACRGHASFAIRPPR